MTLVLETENLANKLLAENKDVLFIDTCILLNVVRCLDINNKHLNEYTVAKEIISKFNNGTLSYNLVVLSPTNDEWMRNVDNLCSNTKSIIDKNYQTTSRIIKVLNSENPITNTINDFRHEYIEEKLKHVSHTLLRSCYCCKTNDTIGLDAFKRSVSVTLPATKGNNSLNDCIIFEEILEIARILRENDFTKKLVFSTNNTKDFGDPNDEQSSINQELNAFQIIYVTNLGWAKDKLT